MRQLVTGSRKHLEGTSDIKQLATGKCEQQNAVRRGHEPTLPVAPLGAKAKYQSIQAKVQLALNGLPF